MNQRLVEKAEYLLAREKGTVHKDPGGKINVVLVYPNTYDVGMSSLGFQGIYRLLNLMPDVVCERAFLPSDEEMTEHLRTKTGIFALESKRPISRFDIIAFSVSFENDYPNIIKILSMSGIPARSAERSHHHPLVIMGGACAFYNPEPMADFIDICFVGEAEEMLPEFIGLIRATENRQALLEGAARIPGIYVPGLYDVSYDDDRHLIFRSPKLDGIPMRVSKRILSDLSEGLMRPAITTPEAKFSDMYLAEAMRGCPWSCRFCVAGHIYKPVRNKPLSALKAEVLDAVGSGCRVGLIGPSMSDYPHAAEVLAMEGVSFSITSLRANPRSADLVSLIKGHKSVAIAPEAGTDRLRRAINKKVTEQDIISTAATLLSGGIGTLRLYFMLGLPTETLADVEGIIDLVRKIRKACSKGLLRLTLSTFIPKPFTPFQWHPMQAMSAVKSAQQLIRKGLSRLPGTQVRHDILRDSYLQGLFALGDRRVARLIESVAMSGKLPSKADYAFYVFRERGAQEDLPWDFIDSGTTKEKLRDEYEKAFDI